MKIKFKIVKVVKITPKIKPSLLLSSITCIVLKISSWYYTSKYLIHQLKSPFKIFKIFYSISRHLTKITIV